MTLLLFDVGKSIEMYRIMSQVVEKGEYRVDRASQKILWALKGAGWTYGRPLRRAAELSQNTQVFYRMEQHLIPSGLVEEAERPDRDDGLEEPRQFRLTREGQQWVAEHAEELASPVTRAETQEMAREASEAAESARASVQNYRKQVHELKQRVSALEELVERVSSLEGTVEYQGGSIDGLRSKKANTSDVEELEERLSGRLSEFEADHAAFEEKVDQGFENAGETFADLSADDETLRKRIEELEQEMEKSWTDRIFKRGR